MKGLSVPPPALREARVNGVSLPYLEQGQGAPVVFVHGATLDYRAWEGQRDAVSQRYRYIALTQRYFGTGAWLDGGEKYALATHAADLATFIRNLIGGPTHLVGWSYGGAIVLTLAVRHPALVKSVFVFEPGIATFVTDPVDAKAAAEDRQEMVTPAATASQAGDNAEAVRLFTDGVIGLSGAFDRLSPTLRSMFLDNARTVPLHVAAPPPPPITCDQLGQIEVPVAIVKGELTRPFFRIAADAASRCIPGARRIVIPNGRHNAPVEESSAFNEALLGFLQVN